MFGKYSPAQLAKSTAALLSSAVLFLGVVAAFVAEWIPTDSGGAAIGGGIAVVCAGLVRTATYLATSAPTFDQIAKHAEAAIDLVKRVRPEAIDASYGRHTRRDPSS